MIFFILMSSSVHLNILVFFWGGGGGGGDRFLMFMKLLRYLCLVMVLCSSIFFPLIFFLYIPCIYWELLRCFKFVLKVTQIFDWVSVPWQKGKRYSNNESSSPRTMVARINEVNQMPSTMPNLTQHKTDWIVLIWVTRYLYDYNGMKRFNNFPKK